MSSRDGIISHKHSFFVERAGQDMYIKNVFITSILDLERTLGAVARLLLFALVLALRADKEIRRHLSDECILEC